MLASSLFLMAAIGSAMQPTVYELLPAVSDAVAVANVDQAALAKAGADGRFQIYVWTDGTNEQKIVVAGIANYAFSHSPINVPVREVSPYMLAIDLSRANPDVNDFEKALINRDKLAAIEPFWNTHFHEFVDSLPYRGVDGVLVHGFWRDVQPAQIPGAEQLADTVGTNYVPIFRADFLNWAALSTVDGGLYYDLRNLIPLKAGESEADAKKRGVTNQDDYLKSKGVSREQIDQQHSIDRSGIMLSLVTDKPRDIEVFDTSAVHPTTGPSFGTITHDPFDEHVNAAHNPFRNPLHLADDGREVIIVQNNNWPEFTLFNNKGLLVAEAPPNLVADNMVPNPHTKRLFPAIGCIRCHGPNDGWQPTINQVRKSLDGKLQALDLVRNKTQSQVETLTQLSAERENDLEDLFRYARNSFNKTVFKASPQWYPKTDSITASRILAAAHANQYKRYLYDHVSPETALAELGLKSNRPAEDVLTAIIPQLPAGSDGISPEDVLTDWLKTGGTLHRFDYNAMFPDLYIRSQSGITQLRGIAK